MEDVSQHNYSHDPYLVRMHIPSKSYHKSTYLIFPKRQGLLIKATYAYEHTGLKIKKSFRCDRRSCFVSYPSG